MQQIERYGVMVLLFMLVTILVVSLWDGEEATEESGREPSVAVAAQTPSVTSARAAGGEDASRPRSVPARERETQRAPLANRRSGSSQRPRRGSRATHGGATALRPDRAPAEAADSELPPMRTVGVQLDPSSSTEVDAGREPSGASLQEPRDTPVADASPTARGETAPRSRTPETPRMAGPVGERRTSATTAPPTSAPATESRSARRAAETRSWTYEIQSGDTLQGIAGRILKDKDRWRDILDANPGLDPRRLMVGQRIDLPGGATPEVSSSVRRDPAPRSAPAPQRTAGRYVVQKGDVLSRIAQRELGSARRWKEIVDLNPGLDPNKLLVGQSLRMPGGAPDEAPARTPQRREAVAQASASTRYKVR